MARRRSRPFLIVPVAVILLVPFLLGDVVLGVTRTPYLQNLVVDPGAEQAAVGDGYTVVPIPGWTQTSNFTAVPYGSPDFPTVAEGARIGGGTLFFSGGPDNTSASASQRILLVGRGAAIDGGRVRVKVVAWLAGYDGQTDAAQVLVRCLRGDGTLITTVKTALVSATNGVFSKKAATRVLPRGTRTLEVVLAARRGNGSYNDGYFDRIDVRIVPE